VAQAVVVNRHNLAVLVIHHLQAHLKVTMAVTVIALLVLAVVAVQVLLRLILHQELTNPLLLVALEQHQVSLALL
jgi:hypothetical protein